MFTFKLANRKSAFIELTSFESMFLVKFQAFALDEAHLLLVKLFCERACENCDATSACSALGFSFCSKHYS